MLYPKIVDDDCTMSVMQSLRPVLVLRPFFEVFVLAKAVLRILKIAVVRPKKS